MGWFGNNAVTTNNQSKTWTGSFEKFCDDHSTATSVVKWTAGTALIATTANTLLKKYAPEKHEQFVATPFDTYVVKPLQKKGLLTNVENKPPQVRPWDIADYGTAGIARLFRINVVPGK